MNVEGKQYRTIWTDEGERKTIKVIDQNRLPHDFAIMDLKTVDDICTAIKDMHVRGAGLIGAAAGYGMYLAALEAPEHGFDSYLRESARKLLNTRPTAKNLEWAVSKQVAAMAQAGTREEKISTAFNTANTLADLDAESCHSIGLYGYELIKEISRKKQGKPVNILTHCNAGWLAFVDYGSATAPVYEAFNRGIALHVWVDETRPRNQGANLTAWELLQHGVPHHLVVDNAGGHLMQHGMVDLVIVGSDRTTATGDVANKIGTYLKALAARDNNIPFYAALPSSTFDWELSEGVKQIPIEERGEREVKYIRGLGKAGVEEVLLCPDKSPAKNYGFDVTPARLVSAIITERGICAASKEGILSLFPEQGLRGTSR